MRRVELGEIVYGVNYDVAKWVLKELGCTRIAHAYPDMGTWWGRNQPKVASFNMPDSVDMADIEERYLEEARPRSSYGNRVFVRERRVRS